MKFVITPALKKLLLLSIGLLIGFSVGIYIIWWGNFFNTKNWYVFKKNISNDTTIVIKENGKKIKKTTIKTQNISQKDDSIALFENNSDEFFYEISDSLKVKIDTNVNPNKNELDTIQEDKLIGIKQYILKIKSDLNDTLLNNTENIIKETNFIIEFWKSPINYRGFKKTYNKAIIFGIENFENSTIRNENNLLYLQINNITYELFNTDKFQKLKIIKNIK